MKFTCNLCGSETENPEAFHREGGAYQVCGSNVRFRVLIDALAREVFGGSIALAEFPVTRSVCGMGLSDAPHYATGLERCFDYTNYYFHTDPYLDIRCPPAELYGKHDFLISTDVYEHVPPPRLTPFVESLKLLKPGGLFVFSVPYTNLSRTLESYPDLHDFRIEETPAGHRLINRDMAGNLAAYTDLFWHGGPGSTLELRVYCKDHLLYLLEAAGFADIRFHDQDNAEIGVIQAHQEHSFVLTARRPVTTQAAAPFDNAKDRSFLFHADERPDHPMLHFPRQIEWPEPVPTGSNATTPFSRLRACLGRLRRIIRR